MSQHLMPPSELQLRRPTEAAPSAPAPSGPIQHLSPAQYAGVLGTPDPIAVMRAHEWMVDGPVPSAPRLAMPNIEDGIEPGISLGDYKLQLRPHVEGVNEPDRYDPTKAAAEQREKAGRPRNE